MTYFLKGNRKYRAVIYPLGPNSDQYHENLDMIQGEVS